MWKCLRWVGLGVVWLGALGAGTQRMSSQTPPPKRASLALGVTPAPLLSLDSLSFLEGTWAAEVVNGREDYAIFQSEVSALGPRYRLTYERNTDTHTQKTEMTGVFEVLLANGKWKPYLQWGGRMLAGPAKQ